jgi:hypothetical protein
LARLHRESFGALSLTRMGLSVGNMRPLTDDECRLVHEMLPKGRGCDMTLASDPIADDDAPVESEIECDTVDGLGHMAPAGSSADATAAGTKEQLEAQLDSLEAAEEYELCEELHAKIEALWPPTEEELSAQAAAMAVGISEHELRQGQASSLSIVLNPIDGGRVVATMEDTVACTEAPVDFRGDTDPSLLEGLGTVLVETNDGEIMTIEKRIAFLSPVLQISFDPESDVPVLLPKVSADAMGRVSEYCRFHLAVGHSIKERKNFNKVTYAKHHRNREATHSVCSLPEREGSRLRTQAPAQLCMWSHRGGRCRVVP